MASLRTSAWEAINKWAKRKKMQFFVVGHVIDLIFGIFFCHSSALPMFALRGLEEHSSSLF